MDDDDKKVFDSLPDSFIIYRGCNGKLNEKGISWTLNKEKAEWFAKRFSGKNAKVIEKKIKKDDVIFYTNERNESEIVIV